MRTGKMTMEEAWKAEKAVADRQEHRSRGFGLMKDRDQGGVVLSNGVEMEWPVPKPDFPDEGLWIYPREVPEGMFALKLNGRSILFDTEEFRKHLRWA